MYLVLTWINKINDLSKKELNKKIKFNMRRLVFYFVSMIDSLQAIGSFSDSTSYYKKIVTDLHIISHKCQANLPSQPRFKNSD